MLLDGAVPFMASRMAAGCYEGLMGAGRLWIALPLALLFSCGSDNEDSSPRDGYDAGTDSCVSVETGTDAVSEVGQEDTSIDSNPVDGPADTAVDTNDEVLLPDGSEDSTPDAMTEAMALESYAEAFCDLMQRCAPYMVSYLYGDETTCVARYVAGGRSVVLPDGPGVQKNVADVVSCAMNMSNMTCPELYAGGRTTACPMVVGTLTEGASCFSDLQCTSGFCDRLGPCGSCAPPIGVGGQCEFANDGCAPDLICHETSFADPALCKQSAGQGESCGDTVICRRNLRCRQGKCEQPGGLGDPCDSSTGSCNGLLGLRCSGKVCVAGTPMADVGGTCGIQGNTFIPCKGTSYCDSTTHRCVAKLDDGSPCEASSANPCLYFASCQNGVCTVDAEPSCP